MAGITPELIPHTKFHKGIWLLPVNRPSWYYFKKQENPNQITNKDFISSVDRPLRELVTFLHHLGIKTTPSCAGHDMPLRHFERIFDSLKEDKHDIRTTGLVLKNIETGMLSVYHDRDYKLPWKREDFLSKALVYQQKGIIGIRTEKKKTLKKLLLNIKINGVKLKEKNSVVLLCTKTKDKRENALLWKEITDEIKRSIAGF